MDTKGQCHCQLLDWQRPRASQKPYMKQSTTDKDPERNRDFAWSRAPNLNVTVSWRTDKDPVRNSTWTRVTNRSVTVNCRTDKDPELHRNSTGNIPERRHQTSVSLYAVPDKDSELHRIFNCSRAPNLSINVSCDWQRLRASQKPEARQETLVSLHCQDWHRPRVSKILDLKHDSELQCHCTSCQDWQSTKAPKNYTWRRAPNLLKSHYAVSNWSLAAASLYKIDSWIVFPWLYFNVQHILH